MFLQNIKAAYDVIIMQTVRFLSGDREYRAEDETDLLRAIADDFKVPPWFIELLPSEDTSSYKYAAVIRPCVHIYKSSRLKFGYGERPFLLDLYHTQNETIIDYFLEQKPKGYEYIFCNPHEKVVRYIIDNDLNAKNYDNILMNPHDDIIDRYILDDERYQQAIDYHNEDDIYYNHNSRLIHHLYYVEEALAPYNLLHNYCDTANEIKRGYYTNMNDCDENTLALLAKPFDPEMLERIVTHLKTSTLYQNNPIKQDEILKALLCHPCDVVVDYGFELLLDENGPLYETVRQCFSENPDDRVVDYYVCNPTKVDLNYFICNSNPRASDQIIELIKNESDNRSLFTVNIVKVRLEPVFQYIISSELLMRKMWEIEKLHLCLRFPNVSMVFNDLKKEDDTKDK